MATNRQSAHLSLLSKNRIAFIKEELEKLKLKKNKFLRCGDYIYFIHEHDESLSCVKINYDSQKGIFVLFFDGRIIHFNRNTGNVDIVNLVNNSHTFLCVGEFFKKPGVKPILLQDFLFYLITQVNIERCNGIRICHVMIFFKPNIMLVQIKQHKREHLFDLDIPSDCISFRDLLRDIRLFFWIQWISSLVSSFNKYSIIFQEELIRLKETEHFRNPQSIQMLYNGEYLNIPIPDISYIGFLFGKILTGNLLIGSLDKNMIMRWVERMFQDIFGKVIFSFFMNFGKFKKSTDLMNKLIRLYPSFKSLECSSSSVPNIPESLNSLYIKEIERIRNAEIKNEERKKRRIELLP
jgi:hypothetical protein